MAQIKLTKWRMNDLESLIRERGEKKSIIIGEMLVQLKEEVDKYGFDYFDDLFRNSRDDDYLNRNEVRGWSISNEGERAIRDLGPVAHGRAVQDIIARAVELYFVTPEEYHKKKISKAASSIEYSIKDIVQATETLEKHQDYVQIARQIREIAESIPKIGD